MKKILALVIATLLVLSMVSAFAATITINRDSTWQASNEEDRKATYTWHRIFDADLTDIEHPVYTISGTGAADKVAVLDSNVFTSNLAADGKYYINKVNGVSDDAVFAALATMVASSETLFPGTAVTSAEATVTLNVGEAGYFYIEASNGKDVAVQTAGSATVTEKNDYPTIDKKQSKTTSDYADTDVAVEVGSYINYEVTVHVPADATKAIKVFDTMSAGLQYDSTTGLALSPSIAYSALHSNDSEYDQDADWQIVFSADTVIANRGQDIVITYRAQVTENALTDTGRENEVKLTYDNANYVLTDKVDYTTYFTGIEKVDGANDSIKLENVKFTLTANGAAFNVTKSGDYYIPGGNSNEVITDSNGLIIIRGLDNTKTPYVLTETETNAGYNLLETPKTLTLVEDTTTAYATDNFDKIENNKGSTLPSTGGIGTTIFYVGGGILVLLAVILLVTKRRMNAED